MTLGEHLEELRSRLIRALLGLAAGTIVCFVFRDYILGFLCWPVLTVLERQGYPAELGFFNPAEAFLTDLKVSLIVGLIVSAPYSIMQVWGFIAAGLYPHERRWVNRFAPVSIFLFFTGAGFLLTIVSPLLLNFLLTYRSELPDFGKWMPKMVVPGGRDQLKTEGEAHETWPPAPTTRPRDAGDETTPLPASYWSGIPAFEEDPADPPEGVPWLNKSKWQIRIRYGDEILHLSRLTRVEHGPRLKPDIRIAEYIMFVLHLTAAFGIGFQVPVVVAFVAAVGIATAKQMGTFRRHVWLAMACAAAIITPPDVTSMLFLLGPMVILYEAGLIAARFLEREQEAAE